MQFTQVIGQDVLKKELPQLMQENRLAHALLFVGKEGSGALPLAIAFAQYITASPPHPVPQEQGAVLGASLFGDAIAAPRTLSKSEVNGTEREVLLHPDVHFSYPVVTKKAGTPPISTDYAAEWREFVKTHPYGNVYDWLQFIGAENKQGNITAHECNDIIRKLNLKSFEGGYKVLLLWLPEYLGNEGNKLLKLIEEPPEKTVFLLVAENESLVLPTILSRCQMVKVPMLEDAAIARALTERNTISAENAATIATVSQGNYREALMLAQHADENWQLLLRDWLNSIMKTGPAAQGKWVEEIGRLGREKQKQFLRYFNHLLQLAIRIAIVPEAGTIHPEQERDIALKINKITGPDQQQAIVEELDKAAYYIERNANGKMLFMALTIKIYHIIQDKIVFLNE